MLWKDTAPTFSSHERIMSEDVLFHTGESGSYWRATCLWKTCQRTSFFTSLDLVLAVRGKEESIGAHHGRDAAQVIGEGSALETLFRSACAPPLGKTGWNIAVKVLMATNGGYLCREDILDLRMRHDELVDKVLRLSAPRTYLEAKYIGDDAELPQLLGSSAGAFVLTPSSRSEWDTLEQFEKHLVDRFSFDWVVPRQQQPRRVVCLGGRQLYDMDKGMYGARGPFETAMALGISLTILDRPGHWLESDTYAYLREEFLPISATNEDELSQEIVAVVENRAFDGILTFSDEYVIATAKAAEVLGLPTEPVEAILRAHYKDETRALCSGSDIQTMRLQSSQQLQASEISKELSSLRYPLIVKPCRGGASRGVKRVNGIAGLQDAILQMEADGLASHGILIETYVDGPEVDANLVLWDGKLLFADISDDFPCLGDSKTATVADDFVETLMVLPSKLKPEEIQLLATSLHRDLLKLGFQSGVFHVEARMQNSSMSYQEVDGILDLVESETMINTSPKSFLVEVNVRPPGLDCAFSTLYTYGVDLCALHYLRALNDHELFATLSKPFVANAQYWCGNCQIPIHRENIYVQADFFDQVYARLPQVASHVSKAEFFVRPGQTVSPVKGVGFIAYFLIYSRESRKHVLEMSDSVQKTAKAVLDN